MESMDPLTRIATLRTHVAWLGETGRMGWWETDALDPEGGGAMLATIFKRTAAWAAVQIAWACASVAEAELMQVRDAITLFRLTPSVDSRLIDWLRRHKHGSATPAALLPSTSMEHATPSDAFAAWAIIGAAPIKSARTSAPAPGVRSYSLGSISRADLDDDDALVRAVERLAAGYVHSGRNRAVVPFLELR